MQNYPNPAAQQYVSGQPGQQQRQYAGQAIQPTMPSSSSANIPVPQQLQAGQGRAMLNAQQQQQQQLLHQQRQQQGIPMQTAAFKRSIGAVDTSIALNANEVMRQHKRRKPTDKTLPSLSHDEGLDKLKKEYERLLELERTLDVTYTRKKAELQDDLASVRKTVWKRLRIRIHNECADQEWQREESTKEPPVDGETANNDKPDVETGKGVPSWTVHIEGAILDVSQVITEEGTLSECLLRSSKGSLQDPTTLPTSSHAFLISYSICRSICKDLKVRIESRVR